MKLVEITTDQQALQACSRLLQAAFFSDDASYRRISQMALLRQPGPASSWIQRLGGDQLIGHYAGIPVDLWLNGQACQGLLTPHRITS